MKAISIERNKNEKEKILGQFFTKENIIERLLDILFEYKHYGHTIKILEPSFGTGNFIKVLEKRGFYNIDGCEIDEALTDNPEDFFNYSLERKYDLIIGNPPFTKYNLRESYYYPKKHFNSFCPLLEYLPSKILKREKEKIENVFILKSLKHLKDKNSTIAFILPISFFIKNRNKVIKKEIVSKFHTLIIYQNQVVWFNYNIPCCFVILTNIEGLKNKIIVTFENSIKNEEVFDIKNIHEELIPQIIFHKNNGYIKNDKGVPLNDFFENKNIKVKKSYKEKTISAGNILEKNKIPSNKQTEDYKIAIVRVGNASVGKCGLINIKEDILNDMFYVFDVKEQYKKNRQIKETICRQINKRIDYFRNITCRVGSKSIKKEDVLNFKVEV